MKRFAGWMVAVCLLFGSGAASGAFISYSASADTQLVPGIYVNSNRGQQDTMYVGEAGVGAGTSLRPLIRFSLAGIPTGSTVTSATLQLGVITSQTAPANTIMSADFYKLLVGWVEGDGTAVSPFTNNGTFGPTWNKPDKSAAPTWATAGADSPGVDRASAASFTLGAADATVVIGGRLLTKSVTADVQAWVNAPATNFGWVAVGTDPTDANYNGYSTDEHANTGFRPLLSVTYVVPEPTSLGLLVLGGLAVLSRRQRA